MMQEEMRSRLTPLYTPSPPPIITSPPHQVLLGVQELLDAPNALSPAQSDAFVAFTQRVAEYRKRVQRQATAYPPPA